MINIRDKGHCPTLEEIAEYVQTPVFAAFCGEIKETFGCGGKIEYSACSMEPGWNIKFKKAGKSLCTIYPRESYFTVMVVIGLKEKASTEMLLPECCTELRGIYENTREGNGQKWLMIDLEGRDELYHNVFLLLKIRRGEAGKR